MRTQRGSTSLHPLPPPMCLFSLQTEIPFICGLFNPNSARERLCWTLQMRAKSPKQPSRVCTFFLLAFRTWCIIHKEWMNLASGGSPHSQSGRAVVSRWVCECWYCCLWGREGGENTPGETGQKGCSYMCFPPSRPLVCPCLAGCSESEQERDRETAVAICHDVHTQSPSTCTFIRVTFLWVLNMLRPKQL